MTKFVNTGDEIDLYFPAGHPESLHVENGQVVDLADLKVEEGDDCWLVGEGDEVRAWPKDRWEKQGAKKAEKSDAKSESKAEAKPAPKPAEKSDDKSGE